MQQTQTVLKHDGPNHLLSCPQRFEGSRAASTDEIVALYGGQQMASLPAYTAKCAPPLQ